MQEETLERVTSSSTGRFTIKDFFNRPEKNDRPILSDCIVECEAGKFYLEVYPKGAQESTAGQIAVGVIRSEDDEGDRRPAKFTVRLVSNLGPLDDYVVGADEEDDLDSADEAEGEDSDSEEEWESLEPGQDTTWFDFIPRKRLQRERLDLCKDGTLVFELKVTSLLEDVRSKSTRVKPVVDVAQPQIGGLLTDMGALWASGEFSDITLQVGDESIPAHRLILVARSPVLRSMFQGEMVEAATGVVRIPDVEPTVMRCLCEYMYTDQVQRFDQAGDDTLGAVLQAAAKYEVNGLTALCSARVAESLTVDNVSEWLLASTRIGPPAQRLKDQCLAFIAAQAAEVQVTEGWQRLVQDTRVFAEVAPLLIQTLVPPAEQPAAKRARTSGGRGAQSSKPPWQRMRGG